MILLAYISRIISKTPSRKLIHHNFWFWITLSEAREHILCAYTLPQRCATIVDVFTWIVFLLLYLFQVTDFWGAYVTISRQLGLRWLKSTQTTSDIFVIGTNVSTTPKSSKMVSIYDENVNMYILSIMNESYTNIIVRQIVGICSSTRKLLQYKLYYHKYYLQLTDFIKIMPKKSTQWPREMQGKYSIWYFIVIYCIFIFYRQMFGGKLPSLGADGIPKLLDLLVFRINARSQL